MKKLLKILTILILYIATVLVILVKTNTIQIKYLENKKEADEIINNGLKLADENLKIATGKNQTFYYNQLDPDAKRIYSKILTNQEKFLEKDFEIEFDNEFNQTLSNDEGMSYLSQSFQNAVDALRYDHVELFYIDFSKIVLHSTTYTTNYSKRFEVSIRLSEKQENCLADNIKLEQIPQIKSQIEQAENEILSNLSGTDYQKIEQIHNWLVDNVTYDQTTQKENIRNIYGTLINREVVCEGYAKTFKYLLDKIDIPCIIVTGDAENSSGTLESHMWNYIQIENTWYSFDVTWDDPILTNSNYLPDEYRYKYFAQGDNINTNHYLKEEVTSGGMKFKYPELYHKEN